MNTLRFYPESVRIIYEKNIKNSGIKISPEKFHNRVILISFLAMVIASTIFYFFNINMFYSVIIFILLNIFFYFNISLRASTRIRKMEEVFPDVISLTASNLRSGITIDRAFLLSSRPEFSPLDEEILKTGKDIATGKDISYSLKKMSERINSEKISKVVTLITSGLKSGGNIADLLEQTSSNMKEKEFIEKRVASNILMYVIFIFFAIGIGAPVLFALSSVLVDVMLNITSKIPEIPSSQLQLPLTFKQIPVSPNFVMYFGILFMLVTDLISSLVIGFVNKGDGKSGLKYFIPLVTFSLLVYFFVKKIISKFVIDSISGI
ncbi:MAG: type II secretion system F family protein [Candidatus Pacearchaeota archaeon]